MLPQHRAHAIEWRVDGGELGDCGGGGDGGGDCDGDGSGGGAGSGCGDGDGCDDGDGSGDGGRGNAAAAATVRRYANVATRSPNSRSSRVSKSSVGDTSHASGNATTVSLRRGIFNRITA